MKGDDIMNKWLKVAISTTALVASLFAASFSTRYLTESILDITMEDEEA